VRHKSFGQGMIVAMTPMGGDFLVEIALTGSAPTPDAPRRREAAGKALNHTKGPPRCAGPPVSLRLFRFVIELAVAEALKRGVCDLPAELLHMHFVSSVRCRRQGQ
jgi:hypothetical protein